MQLAIDHTEDSVWETNGGPSYKIDPKPIITGAELVNRSASSFRMSSEDFLRQPNQIIFREDSFDPVTRIRRGRFYRAGNMQPGQIHITDQTAKRSASIFHPFSVWSEFLRNTADHPLILLGTGERFSIWNVINVEAITGNEELITLKSRSSFAVLPEVAADQIPTEYRKEAIEALQRFADEVHRSGPISVIDRARDAASLIISALMEIPKAKGVDLGEAIKKLEEKDRNRALTISPARIIARLHARAKPNEKNKHGLRSIRENDAELATQCLGFLLCEVGWAEWP